MNLPKQLYVVVCSEWDGNHYSFENVAIYSDRDTAQMAADYMQGSYKKCDIEYTVQEVPFCEDWRE